MKLQSAQGGSFCAFHENEFGNRCQIKDCTNDRLARSQACREHKSDWDKYVYQHSCQNLAGIKRKLQRPAENLELKMMMRMRMMMTQIQWIKKYYNFVLVA